ncbi:tyrosine--tRNA ligase [Spiroplasma endosymbiont of Dilophus febrilis]|uniref:tyrosine--tRNA ligase n=1 Tax=Spiroplasma endosymbiont of Dilophus febrilis TaxID=3066292 RepID=UPI00313D7186
MEFLEELQARGLLKQVTNSEKIKQAKNSNASVYCGIDPTATSLHVGHLLQIVLLYRFSLAGFKPLAVIGGATAMIGDPSFKVEERKLLDAKTVKLNSDALALQLDKLLDHNIKVLNNDDWIAKLNLIDYLRDLGKEFTINYMLDKESIKTRLATGISYTEFSYMLLQAYDFWYLYKNYQCLVQIGGSDQWGNITAGIELIRKKEQDNHLASGLTIELLTQSNGVKFGKTEQGTIWLDANLTSPYILYQFFVNQNDADVEKLLKWLTLLSLDDILQIMAKHNVNKAKRHAQKVLAKEIVAFVHSQQEVMMAINISEVLFSQKVMQLQMSEIQQMKNAVPWITVSQEHKLIDLLLLLEVCSSKTQVRELLKSNAIYVNEQLITDENYILSKDKLLYNKIIFIRKGKQHYYIVEVNSH